MCGTFLRHPRQKTLFSVCVFLLLLLSACSVVWAADEPFRDEWSVMEKDGHAVGLGRTRVWSADDGLHYVIDATLQIEFAGSGPMRNTQSYDVYTDKNGVIRSFDLVVQINDTRITQHGQVEGSKLEVTVTTVDDSTRTESWAMTPPIYFPDGLYEQIGTNAVQRDGKEFLATTWDFANARPVTETYTIEESVFEHKGTLVSGYMVVDNDGIRTFVNRKGTILWQEIPAAGITARFIDESEIPELESLSMDTLSVQSNIIVNRPYASTESIIRVTWEDVPNNLFNWEDNRQKLLQLETESDNKKLSALVEIRRDDRDFTNRLTLPAHDTSLAPYLADADFVKPSSVAIQQLAKEILADEKDGWAATQKLVEWVFNFIEPAMIPETLTVDQILKMKKGKCVEYAVLFASLARAAGLPTKIVLGERFDTNVWIGHMWNEVWLGEWVTIDASHNQVAPDALLLKFVDSDSVSGTQTVRWALVGKLGITIEDVIVPQEDKGDLETGINDQTYTNTDFGYQITAPADWWITEAEEQGLPMAVMVSPADQRIQALTLSFSVPPGTRANQILATRIPALQRALPGFSLLETAEKKLGVEKLTAGTAAWYMGQDEAIFQQENWLVVNGDVCYLFIFSAPLTEWETLQSEFQAIRDSFTLIQ